MSDTNIDWAEFGSANGDYPDRFKFEAVGDSISGTINSLKIATMADGTRIPALTIKTDDGVERSLLASQRALQALLSQHRPATGDRISIVHTGLGDQKPGKSPAKLFDVAVTRTDIPAPAPAAAAPLSAADLI
jgi:hypothetical protein